MVVFNTGAVSEAVSGSGGDNTLTIALGGAAAALVIIAVLIFAIWKSRRDVTDDDDSEDNESQQPSVYEDNQSQYEES